MIPMKQIVTILFLFLIGTDASAQKVVVNGNYVVIDNRNLPTNAITNVPKTIDTPATVAEGSTQNREVYHYFAVSKEVNNGGNYATWASATNACPNYNSGDGVGKWRQPTQRELMLMWILRNKLEAAGVAAFTNHKFWSGTLDHVGSSYVVIFTNGQMSANPHFEFGTDNTAMVRCVRDLAP